MLLSTAGLLLLGLKFVVARNCQNLTVDVSVTARNAVFDNIETPETDLEVTAFVLGATQQGVNGTEKALSGYATVSGRYNISAEYCQPENSPEDYTLQVLTHGVGYDKTYWDLPYNNFNYSYVNYALSQGYHVFSYDRLGIGESSHGDPKNEIQISLEIEALAEMTRMLRNGSVHDIRSTPTKIVHVGHSFGSVQTYALSAMYPDMSDAIILTGFSSNANFLPTFVAGGNLQQARLHGPLPGRIVSGLSDYRSGYLANTNIIGNQYQFFHAPEFDSGLLEFSELNKQPLTIGEMMTQGGVPKQSRFTGPVYIITGSNDEPFCGGNCYGTDGAAMSIPAASKGVFPLAKPFLAFVQPNTGHGINLHYTATSAYKNIHDFLEAHDFARA